MLSSGSFRVNQSCMPTIRRLAASNNALCRVVSSCNPLLLHTLVNTWSSASNEISISTPHNITFASSSRFPPPNQTTMLTKVPGVLSSSSSKAAFAAARGHYPSSIGKAARFQTTVTTEAAIEDTEELYPDPKYPHLLRPSKLMMGYNNEDPAVELTILDHMAKSSSSSKNMHALCVTGGGDNFLSVLAHPAVERVTIVDMNPLQQAMAQLKLELACSDELSSQEILAFMGTYDQVDQVKMDRTQVFETLLKPKLPTDVAELLEQELSFELHHGYNRFSALENTTRHVNFLLEQAGLSLESLWEGTCDLEALEKTCSDPDIITLEEYFHVTGLKGKLPPPIEAAFQTKLKEQGGMNSLIMGHHRIVSSKIQNHMTRLTLLHQYTDQHKPLWLEDETRAAIRDKRDNVEVATGLILEALPQDPSKKYDFITTSNIFDWAPMEKTIDDVQTLASQHLKENDSSTMLLRLAFGGGDQVVDGCKDQLHVHPDLSMEELATVDTAPFFHRIENGMLALQHRD